MDSRQQEQVSSGLDVFLRDGLRQIDGMRVGLITNATGVTRDLGSAVDALHASAYVRLRALFAPEHGLRGEAQAGVKIGSTTDPRSGLPVYSLYGETRTPTSSMLQDLDALLFDVQDCGVRYSTYLATLLYGQEAAAHAGLAFVILDRPNPLSGLVIEGTNRLDTQFVSFVGAYDVPIRHGMTMGELARLVATERRLPAPLVVPVQHWRRGCWFDETDLPWVQPSPNLPTLDSVTLYPGTCLLEGTNLSEGRGTTRPFEIVGAPWIDPFAFADELARRDLPGIAFRPVTFTPTGSKHARVSCGGAQIHIRDRAALRPVQLGIHLLHAACRLNREAFRWSTGTDGRAFIDLLLGSSTPRELLDADAPVAEVTVDWAEQAAAFAVRRRTHLLYEEV